MLRTWAKMRGKYRSTMDLTVLGEGWIGFLYGGFLELLISCAVSFKAIDLWGGMNTWDKGSFWCAMIVSGFLAVFLVIVTWANIVAGKKIAIVHAAERYEEGKDVLEETHKRFEQKLKKRYVEADLDKLRGELN